MSINILKDIILDRVENAAAAGTSLLTSDVVDMKGKGTVAFVAILGDCLDTAVATLQVQGGQASDGSDAANLSGASATFTCGASDGDNKLLAVEVVRGRDRYMRATLTRATANIVCDGILALVGQPAEAPVTQTADVLANTVVLNPA